MKQILFVLAHPHLKKSRANRAVLEAVKDLPGVHVHSLYDLFPHFHMNVLEEQKRLCQANLIVVQHPFYWYSMPPLMKYWLDEVFDVGFAYGPGGTKLKGKDFLVSVTAGGPEAAYAPQGYNRYSMKDFLVAWDQTAHLCQMNWLEPMIFNNSINADEKSLTEHAGKLRRFCEQYQARGTP